MRTFRLVCEEHRAREIAALAREYGLTERQVIEQLVDLGLDAVDERESDAAVRP